MAAIRSSGVIKQGAMRRAKLDAAQPLLALPLFASDEALGAALLGADRVKEFRQMLPLLEQRGFPKIDHLMGGRYVPAVQAHFDRQYGLDGAALSLAPDGTEDFEGWKQEAKRKRPA
jgi:hypothetical protein